MFRQTFRLDLPELDHGRARVGQRSGPVPSAWLPRLGNRPEPWTKYIYIYIYVYRYTYIHIYIYLGYLILSGTWRSRFGSTSTHNPDITSLALLRGL